MATSPPKFAQLPGGDDAVMEYAKFVDAVRVPAAHLLAELADFHNFGKSLTEIPQEDASTSVRGLYCRQLFNWAVFYEASPPCRITVLHVAHLGAVSFEAAECEALERHSRLGK